MGPSGIKWQFNYKYTGCSFDNTVLPSITLGPLIKKMNNNYPGYYFKISNKIINVILQKIISFKIELENQFNMVNSKQLIYLFF